MHVALLRGLNVGPHNRIKMPALVEVFQSAGCKTVSTYVQSGNVLFTASAAVLRRVAADVSRTLTDDFGVNSPVVLRSAEDLARVVKTNPLLTPTSNFKFLHVGFLADVPTAAAAATLDPQRSPPDVFVLDGRELYVDYRAGVAKTKLTNVWFDSKLKTISTFRNWNTVLELARLIGA